MCIKLNCIIVLHKFTTILSVNQVGSEVESPQRESKHR